jgi:hypothetical protein
MRGAAEGHLRNLSRKSEWKGRLCTVREEIMSKMNLDGSKYGYVKVAMTENTGLKNKCYKYL